MPPIKYLLIALCFLTGISQAHGASNETVWTHWPLWLKVAASHDIVVARVLAPIKESDLRIALKSNYGSLQVPISIKTTLKSDDNPPPDRIEIGLRGNIKAARMVAQAINRFVRQDGLFFLVKNNKTGAYRICPFENSIGIKQEFVPASQALLNAVHLEIETQKTFHSSHTNDIQDLIDPEVDDRIRMKVDRAVAGDQPRAFQEIQIMRCAAIPSLVKNLSDRRELKFKRVQIGIVGLEHIQHTSATYSYEAIAILLRHMTGVLIDRRFTSVHGEVPALTDWQYQNMVHAWRVYLSKIANKYPFDCRSPWEESR